MSTGRNNFFSVTLGEDEALRRLRERGHLGGSTQIQGIEKVYVPFHEFTYLVTFPSGRSTMTGLVRLDTILLHPRFLPADLDEPRLVARRGGTLLPDERSLDEARTAVRTAVIARIPPDVARKGETYNLTLEHGGRCYIPFWVVYFAGARQDVFDFLALDARTGEVDDHARETVDRGFMLLDQQATSRNPWL